MTLSDFDRAVSQIMALGYSRADAVLAARTQLRLSPIDDPPIGRRELILEKQEQQEIVKRFRVCRFKVYSLSQARASKQTPGLADLFFVHLERPTALWWESKRQVGGKFSADQVEFAEHMKRCGVPFGSGDRYAAERWLVAHDFAEIDARGSLWPNTTANKAHP
jgi:hypothetical protein